MSNSLQPAVKLSQWDALALESLKAYDWSNETLIERVRAGNLPQDDSKFKFNYSNLTELLQAEADVFEQALAHGYQIKFNTIRGIQSWILLALKLEAEVDLEPGNEAIRVRLTEQEALRVALVLSYGWALQQDAGDAENVGGTGAEAAPQSASDSGEPVSDANERNAYKIAPIR